MGSSRRSAAALALLLLVSAAGEAQQAPTGSSSRSRSGGFPVWLEQDQLTIERIDWSRVAAVGVADPTLRLYDASGNTIFESRNSANVQRVEQALRNRGDWLVLPAPQGGGFSRYVLWERVRRVVFEAGEQPRVKFYAADGSGRPAEFIVADGAVAVRLTRARIASEQRR